MSQALCFNDVQFEIISRNGQPWITARQLSQALGYAREDSVLKIYERNKEEFSSMMSATVKMTVGLTEVVARIFSMRGCHLVGMLSRTPVAKAFRRWVLDVLDRLAAEERAALPEVPHIAITPSTAASRKPLEKLVKVWARQSGLIVGDCWTMLNAAFNLQSITELPEEWIPDAIAWVQGKIDNLTPALPPTDKESLTVAAPTALLFRADFPADMGRDRKEAMQRIERIAREMHTSFGVVRNIVRLGCHPGGKTMRMSLDEREAYEILHNLYTTADESLCAAYNALDAGYKLGRLYGRG